VLEGEDRLGHGAAAIDQPGLDQLVERAGELARRQGRNGLQQLVGEAPPERAPHLRRLARRLQAVQAGEERGLQRLRDDQIRERSLHRPATVPLGQDAALQHRLGELLDEERHAVGARQDRLEHVAWQRATGDLGREGGTNSGRAVTTTSTRSAAARSTISARSSSEVGSSQCASSTNSSTGHRRARWASGATSASKVRALRACGGSSAIASPK